MAAECGAGIVRLHGGHQGSRESPLRKASRQETGQSHLEFEEALPVGTGFTIE
jgi:hypothetical protein